MGIANNIKKLRERSGMTQAQFGQIAGVSDKAVSTWENGIKEPRMGAIQKIADYFEIKKSDIIEEESTNRMETAAFTHQEQLLIKKYHSLNENGKQRLKQQLDDLLSIPKYSKQNDMETALEIMDLADGQADLVKNRLTAKKQND